MLRMLLQLRYVKDLVRLLTRSTYFKEVCGYRDKVPTEAHFARAKHEISVGFTDLFGARGRSWLRCLRLPGNDGLVLRFASDEIDKLDALVDEVSKIIAKEAAVDSRVELLLGYKGIDYTAMVVLNEVGDINRFSSARKHVRWVGLAYVTVFTSLENGVGARDAQDNKAG